MRRPVVFVLIALLMLGQVFFALPSVSAQGASRDPAQVIENCERGRPPTPAEEERIMQGLEFDWEGVCRPVVWNAVVPLPDGGEAVSSSLAVGVADEYGSAPIRSATDLIVVVVQVGVFALDIGSPGEEAEPGKVVVFAAGSEIPLLNRINGEPFYEPTGDVLEDAAGQPCTIACVLPDDAVVEVRTGDRVVASPNALCLYCLIGETPGRDGETGVLEIDSVPEAGQLPVILDLIATFDDYQSRGATPEASASPAMGWAYLHPATRCRNGRG